MKKTLASIISVLALFSVSVSSAYAADTANVEVTIADAEGKLALAAESVTVTDTDGDGALTIHDALYAAHEQFYTGGAAAGYAAVSSSYGLSMEKLWGTQNGGSYGYYRNNTSAMSLADPIQDGDQINAFVYTDLTGWSDTYCYFDASAMQTEEGEGFTLTLSAAGYDAEWNPVVLPVSGAVITVDGKETESKTDVNGKAVITVDTAGSYVISAVSSEQVLVPPVCKLEVSAAPSETLQEETTEETAAPTEISTTAASVTTTAAAATTASSAKTTATPAATGDASGYAAWIAGVSALLCLSTAVYTRKKKQ